MKIGGVPNLWKGTHPHTGLKVSPDKPVAQAVEPKILEQAGELINKALASFQPSPGEVKAPPAPPSPGKKGEALKPLEVDSNEEASHEAQRSILKFRVSVLMSQLLMLKGQPLKALASADAALETLSKCASIANAQFHDNDEAERYAVG